MSIKRQQLMVKGMWLCHNGQCVFEVSVVKGGNLLVITSLKSKQTTSLVEAQGGGSISRPSFSGKAQSWR